MKHLPNLLTLANLFFGCAAISFVLGAQNFTTAFNLDEYIEVPAIEQPYWGSVFIFLAALCDLLDGFAARSLKVFSPIGKDLDSFADMVSFGVAPSMILFKMIWASVMRNPEAMDVSLLATCPAFLVACFAALRLAKFNITHSEQKNYFIGMPTPAVGLFVAFLPLIVWYKGTLAGYLYNTAALYTLIAVLCFLMVSKIRFFKALPPAWNMGSLWPRIALLIIVGVAIPLLRFEAALVGFAAYILLSLVYKTKEA